MAGAVTDSNAAKLERIHRILYLIELFIAFGAVDMTERIEGVDAHSKSIGSERWPITMTEEL